MPDGKSIFAVNLPLKVVLPLQMLKLDKSLSIPNVMYYLSFQWKKKTSFIDKTLTSFCKTFLLLKQLLDGKIWIFRLLCFSVPKIMMVPTRFDAFITISRFHSVWLFVLIKRQNGGCNAENVSDDFKLF